MKPLQHAKLFRAAGGVPAAALLGIAVQACTPLGDLDAHGQQSESPPGGTAPGADSLPAEPASDGAAEAAGSSGADGSGSVAAAESSPARAEPAEETGGGMGKPADSSTASEMNASPMPGPENEETSWSAVDAAAPAADPEAAEPSSDPATDPADPAPDGAAGAAGGDPAPADPAPADPDPAGPAPAAPSQRPPVDANGFAVPLPDDLIDAPIAGEIVFSDEAVWEVTEGVFEPTFEVRTPSASYWVPAPLGTIVSIEDASETPAQWVDFSAGFRPLRGVPSFSERPASPVTTVRDEESQTPTHLRLTSSSADGLWQWVWDFYITHVTFTVNRAPVPIGFGYRGVPGGNLGAEDVLVTSDGARHGGRNSFNGDFAGPFEWAYLADTALGRSLFTLQHGDDDVSERYQVRDNDSSLLRFGDGQLTTLPLRFSLGLIDSTDHEQVAERVEFVAGAIR